MVIEETQHQSLSQTYKTALNGTSNCITLHNYSANEDAVPKISVVIPAFNEEKTIGRLVDRVKQILQKLTPLFEIIVVDDGSKDQTLGICKEKNVILIHNLHNCGKGYALREGFKIARGEFIVTIDSDGEHKAGEIPLLLKPLFTGEAHITVGSRFLNNENGRITSAINTFGNKMFNFIIRTLTKHHFTDSQCGFRAFKRQSLKILNLRSFGYEIETEMIVKLARHNILYREIPVQCPISTIRKSNLFWVKDGFRIFFTILKYRLKRNGKPVISENKNTVVQ